MSTLQQKNHTANYSIVFDIIRVFAMLGVLIVHYSLQFPMPQMMKEMAKLGANCVQIFFVISGYLGCSYFFKSPNASIIGYYKKRSLRILPTYYAAIFAAMIYIELFTPGFNKDVFYLGWLRYFLGLNTILPSTDFIHWNNAFGFWTMTNFIVFYALIPIVIKVVNSFKRGIILFIICYIIHCVIRFVIKNYITGDPFPELGSTLWYSPLVQMQYFALGILTYFAGKENKTSLAAIMLIGMALLPDKLCSVAHLYAILTCIFIISVKDSDIKITGKPRKCLQFISKYSFYVYLSHLIALAISHKITVSIYSTSSVAHYPIKFFIWIVVTILLCYFLESVQRIANKIFL